MICVRKTFVPEHEVIIPPFDSFSNLTLQHHPFPSLLLHVQTLGSQNLDLSPVLLFPCDELVVGRMGDPAEWEEW